MPIVCIDDLGFCEIFLKALRISLKAVMISSMAQGMVAVTVSTIA